MHEIIRHARVRRSIVAVSVAALALAVAGFPSAPAFATFRAQVDFDRDGFGDLAIGIPGENVGGKANAGAVQVILGGRSGVTRADRLITQDSDGIKGRAEANDSFGEALAVGDFDGDGFDDLGVGIPGEGVNGNADAGAVQVFFGGAGGITDHDRFITQDAAGIAGRSEIGDGLGSSLAAGNFDGDGQDDLAAGLVGESIGGASLVGAVLVVYGSGEGPGTRDRLIHQDAAGIQGENEDDDRFGAALTAKNFDGDGQDDLAIGAPGEAVGTVLGAGAVTAVFGSRRGLRTRDVSITQDAEGIKGVSEAGDGFGSALAAGEFDHNERHDLAIGIPGERMPGASGPAGAVAVVFGSSVGLGDRDQFITQDSPGIGGGAQPGDRFGAALSADYFDGDRADDVAVGVPGEDVDGVQDAGAVHVIYGGAGGLGARDQFIHQDSGGIKGAAQENDMFGLTVDGGNFDSDGHQDLVVGAPLEDVEGATDAGAVHVAFGSANGITDRDRVVTQGSGGIKGVVESGDSFGSALEA